MWVKTRLLIWVNYYCLKALITSQNTSFNCVSLCNFYTSTFITQFSYPLSIQVFSLNNKVFCSYLQVYDSDHIATYQYDEASRPYIDLVPRHLTRADEIALGPYIDPFSCRSVRDYETAGSPYSKLVPYQSSRGYDVTSPKYLDVQPNTDTNSSQSDQYEKVDWFIL